VLRIKIIVEGQSEEAFINDVLAPTFWPRQILLVPILLGVPGKKGGRPSYARLQKDILLHLRQDRTAYCSMMLDYYGLGPGFPGAIPPNATSAQAVTTIEQGIKADISQRIPAFQPDTRFVPYLQLHEYEGLLVSDPSAFANGINQPQLASRFQSIRDAFQSPEDINDSPVTAPSKRVIAAYPRYRKVLHGKDGAAAVGIPKMRQECPHFNAWLSQMEALSSLPAA
jgi:hypothetical protein